METQNIKKLLGISWNHKILLAIKLSVAEKLMKELGFLV